VFVFIIQTVRLHFSKQKTKLLELDIQDLQEIHRLDGLHKNELQTRAATYRDLYQSLKEDILNQISRLETEKETHTNKRNEKVNKLDLIMED
jgi:hypothetical protein